jgi:2-oxoisovalerate dehydrogenase E1 component
MSEFVKGFKGIESRSIDGTDFILSSNTIKECLDIIRKERRPILIHAKVPLLNHHTSGVRKEWYRDDLEESAKRDPIPRLRNQLIIAGVDASSIKEIEERATAQVKQDYDKALLEEDPRPEDLFTHEFAPTPVT